MRFLYNISHISIDIYFILFIICSYSLPKLQKSFFVLYSSLLSSKFIIFNPSFPFKKTSINSCSLTLSCDLFILTYFLPLSNFTFIWAYILLTFWFFYSFYRCLFWLFPHPHFSFSINLIIKLFKDNYSSTVYILVHFRTFSMAQYIFEALFPFLIVVFYIYSFYSFYNLQLFFRTLGAFLDL